MSDLERRKQSAVARRLAFNVDEELKAAIIEVNEDLIDLKNTTLEFISTTNTQIAALSAGLTKVTNIVNSQFDPTNASSWEARLIALETVSVTGTTNEIEVTPALPYGFQVGLPDNVTVSDNLSADNLIVKNLGKLQLNNLTNSVSVSHSCPSTLANNHEYIWPISMGVAKESLMIQSFLSPRVAQLVWYTPVFLNEIQTFTAKQSFTSGVDVTGNIDGPKTSVSTLTVDNGLGSLSLFSDTYVTIGSQTQGSFFVDGDNFVVDGSGLDWLFGSVDTTLTSTGTLFLSGNITLQNSETIRNTTNGRIDLRPSPTAATAYGLYVDMVTTTVGVKLGTIQSSTSTLDNGKILFGVQPEVPTLKISSQALSTSSAGCLEYDGQVVYGNSASGRGLIPCEQTSIITSDRTILAATGDQNIFDVPQDTITLAANTTYQIRGYLYLTMGTTSARHLALKFIDSPTVNLPTIHFATIGTPSNGGAAVRTQDSAFYNTTFGGNITNATFSTNSYNAFITGIIKTADSVTITPKIAFSANPGGTNVVKIGTYITFTPVGTNGVLSIGPWS